MAFGGLPKSIMLKVYSYFFAGFNVETVEYKNISFTVWDVGGQDKVCILKTNEFYDVHMLNFLRHFHPIFPETYNNIMMFR